MSTPLATLLTESSILLDAMAADRDDAVRQAGEALLAAGAVDESYVTGMLDRERSVSTYVGEGIAIPHGTRSNARAVKRDAVSVLRFDDGVDWDGDTVTVVIGIAATGNGHIALLSRLAAILLRPGNAETLRRATNSRQVYELLADDEETRSQHARTHRDHRL